MSKHHPLPVLSSPQLLTPCSQAHALQDEAGCEKKEASLEGKDIYNFGNCVSPGTAYKHFRTL